MQTFNGEQQEHHRKAFIEDCHQKAWGAACNADWIGKQSDELTSQYEKLQKEDADLDAEIERVIGPERLRELRSTLADLCAAFTALP